MPTREGLLTPLAPLPNQPGVFLPNSSVKESLGLASAFTAAGGRSEVGNQDSPLVPGNGGTVGAPSNQSRDSWGNPRFPFAEWILPS